MSARNRNAEPKPRAHRSAEWFIGSTLSRKLRATFLDDPYFVVELPDQRTQVEHAAVSRLEFGRHTAVVGLQIIQCLAITQFDKSVDNPFHRVQHRSKSRFK